MFWLRNKKLFFWYAVLTKGLTGGDFCHLLMIFANILTQIRLLPIVNYREVLNGFTDDTADDTADDIWALTRENLSSGFVNNKGADQPAHARSPISTFAFLD